MMSILGMLEALADIFILIRLCDRGRWRWRRTFRAAEIRDLIGHRDVHTIQQIYAHLDLEFLGDVI